MSITERVTVTLSAELVEGIDRVERNRSRFIAEATEHELARRRHEGLLNSVRSPHPETADLADGGLEDWTAERRTLAFRRQAAGAAFFRLRRGISRRNIRRTA